MIEEEEDPSTQLRNALIYEVCDLYHKTDRRSLFRYVTIIEFLVEQDRRWLSEDLREQILKDARKRLELLKEENLTP